MLMLNDDVNLIVKYFKYQAAIDFISLDEFPFFLFIKAIISSTMSLSSLFYSFSF